MLIEGVDLIDGTGGGSAVQSATISLAAATGEWTLACWAFGMPANLLVHPAAVYVGLKSDRLFVQRGEVFGVAGEMLDAREVQAAPGPTPMRTAAGPHAVVVRSDDEELER